MRGPLDKIKPAAPKQDDLDRWLTALVAIMLHVFLWGTLLGVWIHYFWRWALS